MQQFPASVARVQAAASVAGLEIDVRIMTESTRSADEAAAACGTSTAQIVKSLVFVGQDSGRSYLLLVSGANRVAEEAVAARIGEGLVRPDAKRVREITGYAIGGIPPIGHATQVDAHIDPDLLTFDEVWAAAGTPSAVFPVNPRQLQKATGARLLKMTPDAG